MIWRRNAMKNTMRAQSARVWEPERTEASSSIYGFPFSVNSAHGPSSSHKPLAQGRPHQA